MENLRDGVNPQLAADSDVLTAPQGRHEGPYGGNTDPNDPNSVSNLPSCQEFMSP